MVRKAANTETYEITIYPCDQGIARLQFLGGANGVFQGEGASMTKFLQKKSISDSFYEAWQIFEGA